MSPTPYIPNSEIAIKVENLTKIYPLYNSPRDRLKEALSPSRKKYHNDFYALKDVSFEVKKGETIGIIGQNGSGKSTLLKILSNVLTPSKGQYIVNGRISSLLELGTGFNPELNGIENIYFYGTILGFNKEEIDNKLSEILQFADIGEFVNQPVKTYSSGMYVRLAFAVAVQVDPEILIVDEALSVGDIRFQLKCFRKFEEFREKGKTIVFVSHSTPDIVRLCSRTIWMDKGIIRKAGISKNIVEEYLSWMVHDTGIQDVNNSTIIAIETSTQLYKLEPIPRNAFITGDVGASVDAVGLFTEDNHLIKLLDGPKKVKVIYQITTNVRIENPYFGFQVINSKGLKIMGINNHVLVKQLPAIEPGKCIHIIYSFFFPEIENGIYLLAVGINDGTLDTHVRYQNVWDAYEFQFQSQSIFQKQQVLLKLNDCVIDIIES